VWDWVTGKEKHDIPIQEAVEPFIVVKGKKRRWFDETEMGGENSTFRARKKGRKGKGRGKAKEVSEQDMDMEDAGDDDTPAPAIVEGTPEAEGGPQESIRPEVEELVLAIHKINSFETLQGNHLVFSAIGYLSCSFLYLVLRLCPILSCTSLFTCGFPSKDDESPAIRTFDFNKPVIDFHINDSIFWVLVDDGWGDENAKSNPVRCVKWSNESQEVGYCG